MQRDHYAPEVRARWQVQETKLFMGKLRYNEVDVMIDFIGEKLIEATDSTGRKRIIQFTDCSFASEYIARQNIGQVVMLKIRAWT